MNTGCWRRTCQSSSNAQSDEAADELEVGRKHDRRDDADQHRAAGAAERDHQIEAREVLRRGLQPRELAVAEHAGDEEARAEHADLQREARA